ncbi:hypothetical protein EDD52_101272 [Primorskyibacter sedentarius]|uniref:Uncharacterized protein n=1 Tax=Primorskyibacter sedentarius TaxID=745311 RepID=A0A4R3JLF3_9RHOB|nr:hypothetical protein EDD52_101272 [Primorskyibacter sedentarius]
MQKTRAVNPDETTRYAEPCPCRSELWNLADVGRATEWLSFEWLLDHVEGRARAVR